MDERKLNYEISKEYAQELLHIKNKLNQLERGRIYELTKVPMDGYLSTNIEQLRDMINELLNKIQNGEEGTTTRMANIMKDMDFI